MNFILKILKFLFFDFFREEDVPIPPQKPPVDPKPDPELPPFIKSKLVLWAQAIKQMEGWFPGSVSQRNNNPGNIKGLSGSFLKFETEAKGWSYLLGYLVRAATGNHTAYAEGITLLQFFGVYAPEYDNNYPYDYAGFVAEYIGVPVDTKIIDLV